MTKPFTFGAPRGNADFEWVKRALLTIQEDSRSDIEAVVKTFIVSGSFTPTRTLNLSTATLPDLLAVFATLITDIQNRGQRG